MARPAQSSAVARTFAPLAGSLWIAVLLLSIVVTAIWSFDIGEAQINGAIKARELRAALLWLVGVIDILWLALVWITVYSSTVRREGIAAARRSTLLVLGASWLLGAISVWSGWPLGKIHFTERLGFLVGPVSVGWLLIWCVFVFGARDLLLATSPRTSHTQIALLTGGLASLAHMNLEPLAWKMRAWWLWLDKTPPPAVGPLQSHLAWFAVSAGLAWCFRTPVLTKTGSSRVSRAGVIFLIFQAMLLLSHLGSLLRR